MFIISKLRFLADTNFPFAAQLYRTLSDKLRIYPLHRAPQGFFYFDRRSVVALRNSNNEPKNFEKFIGAFDVIIDVGANIGFYSLLAACSSKKIVLSFEPAERNYRLLRRNIWLNRNNGSEFIRANQLAIAEKANEIVIYGDGVGASLIKNWAGMPNRSKRIVKSTSVDDIVFDEFKHKNIFLKIDVEGYEFQVIKGALATLSRSEITGVWVEVLVRDQDLFPNPNWKQLIELFCQLGFLGFAVEIRQILSPRIIKAWQNNYDLLRENTTFLFVNNSMVFSQVIDSLT